MIVCSIADVEYFIRLWKLRINRNSMYLSVYLNVYMSLYWCDDTFSGNERDPKYISSTVETSSQNSTILSFWITTRFFFYISNTRLRLAYFETRISKISRFGQWNHFKMIVLIPNSSLNTFLSGRVRFLFRKFDFC